MLEGHTLMSMHTLYSLVPWPSHHPVFDRCSMLKRRGKAWSIYHVNDVSAYLGRQRRGGVPDWKNELEAFFLVVSVQNAGASNVCEVKNVPLLVQDKERVCIILEKTYSYIAAHAVYAEYIVYAYKHALCLIGTHLQTCTLYRCMPCAACMSSSLERYTWCF